MALLDNRKKQRKNDRNSVVNSAKTLLANIRFMDVDSPVRTMALTSAVPNEGKTFVTANLASAIATSGKTVLVVECDMRRRSMSRALGTHPQYGIYSVMSGERTIQEAAVKTSTPNMYFLDAEPRIPNPSDLLNSNRFASFVDLARNNYDYVLFDTPPVGTFVDAAVLGTKVDAVFMVVREGYTRKAEIASAADQLKKSGCNLAGIIMNFCERSSNDYYYYYYYTHEDKRSSPMPSLGANSNTHSSSSHSSSHSSGQSSQAPQHYNGRDSVPTAPPARQQAPAASSESDDSAAATSPNMRGLSQVVPNIPDSNYDEF